MNFWTDFNQVPLPAKAVFSLPGVWHSSTPFEGFAQGMGILTMEDKEDILDRARLLGEACDSPQVTPRPRHVVLSIPSSCSSAAISLKLVALRKSGASRKAVRAKPSKCIWLVVTQA